MKWTMTRRGLTALVAVGALGATACDTAEPPTVLDWGHSDGFMVSVEDGEFDVHIHDAWSQEYAPGEAVLHAGPASKTSIPADPNYAFLGAAGSDVWILPQTPNPDLLWLGWATSEIPYGVLQGDALQWRLLAVNGPGAFHIFTTNSFGRPTVIFDSDNGLPDTTTLPALAHVHGNWAFGAPGQYTVAFQALGTLADGTPLDSGPIYYTLTVEQYECGDVDDPTVEPSTADPGESVEVSYVLANCGTESDSLGVDITVTAPDSCGGAVTTAVAPTTLAVDETVAGTAMVTAPSCPGTYQVKAKPTGVRNSYAAVAELQVG